MSEPVSEAMSEAMSKGQGRLKKMIFVDDSDDEIFILRIAFKRQLVDLEIVHFFDLPSYFAYMEGQSDVDLAQAISVLDLNLTIARGTAGLAQLRSQPRYASHIAGICSGSDDPADRQTAFESGADFFVSKPLDLTALRYVSAMLPHLSVKEQDGSHRLLRTFD